MEGLFAHIRRRFHHTTLCQCPVAYIAPVTLAPHRPVLQVEKKLIKLDDGIVMYGPLSLPSK